MPVSIKTMRDIWDQGRKKKEARKYSSPASQKILPLEIEKYYLDYLARKRAFLETKDKIARIFIDYENHLGGAGFSKV